MNEKGQLCAENRFAAAPPQGACRKAALFIALIPLLLFCSLLFGPSGIGLPDIQTPLGRAIFSLRLNRLMMGAMTGAALSSSGVIFQALLRNPLAEPYVLGVSGGAGLGATLCILLSSGIFVTLGLPVVAFFSAVLTLMLVYTIAGQGSSGQPSVYSLILSGVIVSSVSSSIIMFLVSTASIEGMHSVIWWMLGSLQPVPAGQQILSATMIIGAIACSWLLAPRLNALALGREMAHYQGLRADRVLAMGLLLGTLLAATSVALSGMIGFVGLIVPHVMRALFGPDHRKLLPLAAIGGGTFLVLCDAIARTIFAPVEIPVGVVTALAGGPFFLIILQRRMKQAWVS
ncbi:MAG: iron ABC transporter permease [Chlorobiaceae bacterium]